MKKEIVLFTKKIIHYKIYKSWFIPFILFTITGMLIYWSIPNLSNTSLDQAGIARILTIFVIF